MEIKVDLAGMILRITGPDAEMFREPGVLMPFVVDSDRVDREVTCGLTEAFPKPAGTCVYRDPSRCVYREGDAAVSYIGAVERNPENAYILTRREAGHTDIRLKRDAVPDRITPKTLLNGLEAEHLIAANHGFLLHCSYISHGGKAILFTAPSGVGKSTQAELWRSLRGAEVINGDRAAVRIRQGKAEAWGVPFSGSSGICRRSCLPLGAIVYLRQAPQTTIRRMTGVRAFRQVWEGVSVHTWSREDVSLCSETVQQTVQQVPIFELACTPDESAIQALEGALAQIQR